MLTTFLTSHPTCTLCPLHTTAHSIGVPTKVLAPNRADAILWVGMNPGFHEDANNEPFFPAIDSRDNRPNAGWIFHNAYLHVDPPPHRVTHYIANIVRCGPAPLPPNASRKACWPYTLTDLTHILTTHTRVAVVVMGDYAATYFTKPLGLITNLKSILHHQAQTITHLTHTFTLFGTWHPAFILRQANAIHSVEQHLSLLDDWITNTMAIPTTPHLIPPRSPHP